MARRGAFSGGDVWETLVSAGVALVAIYIVLFAVGVDISSDLAIWMFFGFIALGLVVKNTTDITVGFALTTIAIIIGLTALLPSWVSEPFDPLVGALAGWAGVEIGIIDPVGFGVMVVVFVFLMMAVRIRLTGKKKKTRTTIELALTNMLGYVREYLTIGRLIILFASASTIIALQQSAQVLAVVGGVAADAPLVVSNAVAVLGGYLSLGGTLPVIGTLPLLGDLTAAGFLFLGLVVLAAAAAVKWEGSGPIAQFLRNRGL